MTCKEAFAKALDEALSPSNDEHSSTPCKDAFAQALDELGYAADANPFKSAVGKIKGMFGKANQAAANKAASPAMQGPYAGFTPPGMTKTLAQHMEEGCEAQKPENCKYNKALAEQIAQQEGIDPAQAMQKAIGIHNGGGAESQQARLGGAAATVEINFEDPKSTAQEIVKDPSKVDALPEGVPGEEKEIVTKAGEINVESATQEAVVRALNEKAMNGDADAQKALEGLKAIGEIGSQDNPDDAEPWIPPLPQEGEEESEQQTNGEAKPQSKCVSTRDFDSSKLDFDNNIYLVHRTSEEAANQIMDNGFKMTPNITGTAMVVRSREQLEQLFQSQRDARANNDYSNDVKGGDSAIIMALPKSALTGSGKNIDDDFFDRYQKGVPADEIVAAVNIDDVEEGSKYQNGLGWEDLQPDNDPVTKNADGSYESVEDHMKHCKAKDPKNENCPFLKHMQEMNDGVIPKNKKIGMMHQEPMWSLKDGSTPPNNPPTNPPNGGNGGGTPPNTPPNNPPNNPPKNPNLPSWQDDDNGMNPDGTRKETKIGRKTYVDVSNMPFWESIKESWKAGWAGKDIVTDYMKVTGKWDKILGSKSRDMLRSGIASSMALAQIDNMLQDPKLSDDERIQLQFIREELEQAKTPAQKTAAFNKLLTLKESLGMGGGKGKGENRAVSRAMETAHADGGIIDGSKRIDEEGNIVEDEEAAKRPVPETNILGEPGFIKNGKRIWHAKPSIANLEEKINAIGQTLSENGVKIGKEEHETSFNNTFVRFDLNGPCDQKQLNKLVEQMAFALKCNQDDIIAKVDNKNHKIVIGVKNDVQADVSTKEMMNTPEWDNAKKNMRCPIIIGMGDNGKPLIADMEKLVHLLVAGDTGNGKSVAMNTILCSIMMAKSPAEVKMVLIDTKKVEFEAYKNSAHNAVPVANTVEDAMKSLEFVKKEMENRIDIIKKAHCKNIDEYNAWAEANGKDKMPTMILAIDELTEVRKAGGAKFDEILHTIGNLARAQGIHMICATQEPTKKNIGPVKGDFPSRLGFKINTPEGSEAIFTKGDLSATKLGRKGQFVFTSGSDRVQGQGAALGSGDEKRVVNHWNGKPIEKEEETEIPDGGVENPGEVSPSGQENPAEGGGNPDGGANPDEGGSDKPSETDPFDDLVSEESEKNFHAEQVQKQTAAAEEWRNQKLDEIKNSNLSWDDRKKAVDAAKKEYAARLEAAKQGKAYEPPSEKPKEGEKGKEGEEPELTASQAEIKKEFDNEMQRELAAAEKLKLRDKIKEKERIKAKYAKVDADIKNGKSMTEILDRIDKEEQEEADKKAAAEKAKADAEQAKTAKEKADKEKTAAEEAKKAEATKAKEKSKAEYTSLKDKALGDLKKQIGKNGYTEADYQKDKLALEEKHSKRLADLEAGKSEKDIYDRETAEQAEVDKKNEALRKTVRTEWKGKPVAGAKAHVGRGKFVPLDPKEEKEYAAIIPKGWKLDGDKTGAGVAYARNPVDGSYGFINPKTKTFTKMVDTSHPKYKGVDSKEAKEAKEALKGATAKNHAELEKAYNNVAYGHDEALPARAFLLSGIADYLGTVR